MIYPSGLVAEVAEIEAAKVAVQKEVVDLIIYNRTIAGHSRHHRVYGIYGLFWGPVALARRCGLDIPDWQRKKARKFSHV